MAHNKLNNSEIKELCYTFPVTLRYTHDVLVRSVEILWYFSVNFT